MEFTEAIKDAFRRAYERPVIAPALHYAIDNPRNVVLGGLGLLAALYALPKLYYMISEGEHKANEQQSNKHLYNIAMSNQAIMNALAPKPDMGPRKDNYNYLFTE
jgi:hypothetical protein